MSLARDLFSVIPSPLYVIASNANSGVVSILASSVSSVSMDPPTIVFSLSKKTGNTGALRDCSTFCISALGSLHADFARSISESSVVGSDCSTYWDCSYQELPRLVDSPCSIYCRRRDSFSVGSSLVIVAEVFNLVGSPYAGSLLSHHRDLVAFDRVDG